MSTVRPELESDYDAVRRIHCEAFGRPDEADLVETLRASTELVLSLVAERRGEVVGHVLFTQIAVVCGAGYGRGVGLAPLGVRPDHQRSGIGTDLVRYAIASLKNRRYGILVVLGDPGFYRRFGFKPARQFNLRCSLPAPPEAFQALPLDAGWCGAGGLVRFAPAFDHL